MIVISTNIITKSLFMTFVAIIIIIIVFIVVKSYQIWGTPTANKESMSLLTFKIIIIVSTISY